MFIFSNDGKTFVNSNSIKGFYVSCEESSYLLCADSYLLKEYNNRDDAIKELNSIFNQLESGSTSYQVR